MRCLTNVEMRDGLNAEAAGELAQQRAVVCERRDMTMLVEMAVKFKMASEQLAEALLAGGRPAYVKVEGVNGIVRQMPDGTRHAIEIIDGTPFVMRALPPADALGRATPASATMLPGQANAFPPQSRSPVR